MVDCDIYFFYASLCQQMFYLEAQDNPFTLFSRLLHHELISINGFIW